jgi:hypothetical protein
VHFKAIDNVYEWLRGRPVAEKQTLRPSRFCATYRNHMRCSLPPHPETPTLHVMMKDDSTHFGDEAYKPAPPKRISYWDACPKYSQNPGEGCCMLSKDHIGACVFRTLFTKSDSEPEPVEPMRCNIWHPDEDRINGVRCTKVRQHIGGHVFVAKSHDLAIAMPSAARRCILTPNCAGTMQASMRVYATAPKLPVLWWSCRTCNGTPRSFGQGKAKRDTRGVVQRALEICTTEAEADALNAADTSDDECKHGIPLIAVCRECETSGVGTAKLPTQSPTEAALVASEIRDMLNEGGSE